MATHPKLPNVKICNVPAPQKEVKINKPAPRRMSVQMMKLTE